MPSELYVPVAQALNIRKHDNADSLDVCEVLGWQVCIKRGSIKKGELGVYFPVDSLLPPDLADDLGVREYLGGHNKTRVKAIRLRKEVSFGIFIPLRSLPAPYFKKVWKIKFGNDVSKELGIKKYEPPVRGVSQTNSSKILKQSSFYKRLKQMPVLKSLFKYKWFRTIILFCLPTPKRKSSHLLLSRYTKIPNLRNFPRKLIGKVVCAREKVHGANFKIGYILKKRRDKKLSLIGSSMKVERSQPPEELLSNSSYWFPYSTKPFRDLLALLKQDYPSAKQILVFGEVYGSKYQNFHYGTERDYICFDILVDGKYLEEKLFRHYTSQTKVPVAPILYEGEYSYSKIKSLVERNSVLHKGTQMEGCVVRTINPNQRLIYKYLSNRYLLNKNKTDYTEE